MDKAFRILVFTLLVVVCSQLLVFCIAIAKTTSTNLTTDQSALLDFKSHIITSEPYHILTANWSNSSSVCSWFGVTCGVRHRRVISLIIPDMGLLGTISPQLGNLSFLSALDLGYNNLSGALPLELSLLHRLKFISVMFNNLVGEIPSWLGVLPSLEYISLRNNSFTDGEIPQELGRLQNLQVLSIQGNRLSGVIPSPIFNISTLKIIAFRGNELSGGLPNELCRNLPFLEGIYLSFNMLSGQIPSNMSQCGTHLQFLGLSYNMFNGGIPAAIGELKALEHLELGGNNLNGTIPQEIGNLQKLVVFGLEINHITGGLPTNMFNISSLQIIVLRDNELGRNLPTDMRNLTALKEFHLQYNHFTEFFAYNCMINGNIPPDIGNLSNLVSLSLYDNEFSGNIPPIIKHLQKLQALDLSNDNIKDRKFSGSHLYRFVHESVIRFYPHHSQKIPKFRQPVFGSKQTRRSKRKKVKLALFIVAGVVVLISIVSLANIFTRYRRKQNTIFEQDFRTGAEDTRYNEGKLTENHVDL
ncbi:hypothetical protein C2S52_005593 [Perilla frutescens var. hirtella]|nr:hypothetical protein C2S52_005593 [Perilla frutescens var. hirtella]